MNELDFGFINKAKAADAGKPVRSTSRNRAAPLPAADAHPLTAGEGEKLLHIVGEISQIKRHYELFQLLQSEEIQHFIPHQVLISSWGTFCGSKPALDVISAIQGVRTGQLNGCGSSIEQLLKNLFERWVAGGRRPILLENTTVDPITNSACSCALHAAMRRMRSVMVHGFRSERDNLDSLYVALNPVSVKTGPNPERLFFLAESIIAQVDMAFNKVAALKPAAHAAGGHFLKPDSLSAREQEIIKWMTAGKTNAEIAGVLGISAFTVKNHAQRIFRKLGATNRTEAVAKYRLSDSRT